MCTINTTDEAKIVQSPGRVVCLGATSHLEFHCPQALGYRRPLAIFRHIKQNLCLHGHSMCLHASLCWINRPHLGQARTSGHRGTPTTVLVGQVIRILSLGSCPVQLAFPHSVVLLGLSHGLRQYQQNSNDFFLSMVQIGHTTLRSFLFCRSQNDWHPGHLCIPTAFQR